MKKEELVNFLTSPHEEKLELKPSNVHIYMWVGGNTCICELEYSLFTYRIKNEEFYCGIANPQSRFKQTDQF